ncbi:hypothetical protein BROUX41_005061 [Berkeleyomyces rouxiae]|uniref:uncharacterized protein n=1 Tax=Berkeleyomyces rouxiae TaxID=2035830 RepID=UPI003B7B5204
MPPRKKTKKNLNKPFVIHRDESCLSSNNSQQDQDAEASVPGHETREPPTGTGAWDQPPEHEESEPQLLQSADQSQIIYSDPDEPRWSELDEIVEETEPESTNFEDSCYHYDPAADDNTQYNRDEPSRCEPDNRMEDSQIGDSHVDVLQGDVLQGDGNTQHADDSRDGPSEFSNHLHHDESSAAGPSLITQEIDQEDCSLLNHSIDQSYNAENDQSELHYDITDSRLENDASTPRPREESSSPLNEDEEEEDGVFSDHSLRSSLGSYDSGMARKAVVEEVSSTDASAYLQDNRMSPPARSTHMSDFAHSLISETDGDDSTFASKDSLYSHYRSRSSPHHAQMSPTAASPSSSKRGGSKSAVTRLGSPAMSIQQSPKGRTPTRFRPHVDPAPLVLLHVTMLPLQWSWAPVLEEAAAYAAEGNAMLSEPIKNLRDAWIILQDRIGDTVLERGVLLSHPQNDYEVLEERVLEAMELPLRRRARILECGHYLGPANVMSLSDDEETEDDDSYASYEIQRRRITSTRHWCTTCRNEIKVDALGPGKIFRVKVYASNGLMRAGAWKACWREMERIDVEIEPIVNSSLHIELAELAVEQQRRAEEAASKLLQEKKEAEAASRGIVAKIDDDTRRLNEEFKRRDLEREIERQREEVMRAQPKALTSPPPAIPIEAPPCPPDQSQSSDQFAQKSPYDEPSSAHVPPSPSTAAPTTSPVPPSPLPRQIPDTFPELLMEALRVLIRDRKNVVIGILSFLALMLAVRGGQQQNYLNGQHDHFPRGNEAYAPPQYANSQPNGRPQQHVNEQQQPQMQYQNAPPVQHYQQDQQAPYQQMEYQGQVQNVDSAQQVESYNPPPAQAQSQYEHPGHDSAQYEQHPHQPVQYGREEQHDNSQYDYPPVQYEQEQPRYEEVQTQDPVFEFTVQSESASPIPDDAWASQQEAHVDFESDGRDAFTATESATYEEVPIETQEETESNTNMMEFVDFETIESEIEITETEVVEELPSAVLDEEKTELESDEVDTPVEADVTTENETSTESSHELRDSATAEELAESSDEVTLDQEDDESITNVDGLEVTPYDEDEAVALVDEDEVEDDHEEL